jgi:glutamine cyclotransferase
MVAQVDLASGEVIKKIGLDGTYFGEGITIFGDEVFQLTWQEQKCFVYDSKSLQLKLKDFTYTGEGWGLCNDGKSIIMSDGTERITFRNPETFQ